MRTRTRTETLFADSCLVSGLLLLKVLATVLLTDGCTGRHNSTPLRLGAVLVELAAHSLPKEWNSEVQR